MITKSDRVQLNEEGRRAFPVRKDRKGTAMSSPGPSGCIRVLWDGRKSEDSIHRDYLEPAQKG